MTTTSNSFPNPVVASEPPVRPRLRLGIVLRVRQQDCEILIDGRRSRVGYAAQFPRPRTERISPGHLVAVARTSAGAEVILWRWYDAVVVDERDDAVILWEPAHGEVAAMPRPSYRSTPPGSRAYASAGLPGADWWVAGPVVADASRADVDLDEVDRLYTDHGLWDGLAPG